MSRVRKNTPGRILFVGSGPGDPALLTVRAHDVLTGATIAFTDPDVDKGVVALVGTDHGTDPETGEPVAEVRPALGEPAEVAKTLVAEAKAGHDVVRLVSGDPLTTDSVIAEVNAVARTQVVVRGSAGPARRIVGAELRRHGPRLGPHRGRRARRGRLGRAGRGSGPARPARHVGASRRDRERARRARTRAADSRCDHGARHHASAAHRRGDPRDAQRRRVPNSSARSS